MKKNLKLILVIFVISFTFLSAGLFIGKYIFEDKSVSNNIINNNNNNVNIDENNEVVQLALGRYLYFLAGAFYKNCDSSYFDLEYIDSDNDKYGSYDTINVNNYGVILNSFTEEYKKKDSIRFKSSCHVKVDDNKYELSNCWCGSGSPSGISNTLKSFKVTSATENEITYSVIINEYNNDLEKNTNTYNDLFTIKKIDNNWKIDNYTYRYINYK